jgi:hypothetical protein
MSERLILDASALKALFDGNEELFAMLRAADEGDLTLVLPTVAVAEAETTLFAGMLGWRPFLLTNNVEVVVLDMGAALDVGATTGPLDARHAAREAQAGTVVTCDEAAYRWLTVTTRVVG